jgi:formate hydrogenlyase transcriptional activator
VQREVLRHSEDSRLPFDGVHRHSLRLFSARIQAGGNGLAARVNGVLSSLLHTPEFQFAALALHDHDRDAAVLVLHAGELNVRDIPVRELCSNIQHWPKQAIEIEDTASESRLTQLANLMQSYGFKSVRLLPVGTEKYEHGSLILARTCSGEFPKEQQPGLYHAAERIALLLENSLLHDVVFKQNAGLTTLFDINAAVVSTFNVQEIFEQVSISIRPIAGQDFTCLALYDKAADAMNVRVLDVRDSISATFCENSAPVADCPSGTAYRHGTSMVFGHADLQAFKASHIQKLLAAGVREICYLPLNCRGKNLGSLGLAGMKPDSFPTDDMGLLAQIASQVAVAVENATSRDQIARSKDKLAKEKRYLEEEINASHNFGEVVGDSAELSQVLRDIEIAAPSDANVLVLGETGTGKELVARAVHRLSSRSQGNFIKLNCAAIPTGLLESELFGHEKGAFTGAITQKLGRIELADKGTLFLDEIGEIPMDLQPKLLRVLQDQEFERLGGVKTIKVNVRLVAATNRDLARAVNDKEFRSDLYYRLNVFPIRVPPLRERIGDIHLLVKYFVQKFARRMGKRVDTIPEDIMHQFEDWHWPGNIRELENFIERSVILTQGPVFFAPMAELRVSSLERPASYGTTLEEVEREYIVRTLRDSEGVIAGARGAAARLGMKRTTLQSRIQKLGISRAEYQL